MKINYLICLPWSATRWTGVSFKITVVLRIGSWGLLHNTHVSCRITSATAGKFSKSLEQYESH